MLSVGSLRWGATPAAGPPPSSGRTLTRKSNQKIKKNEKKYEKICTYQKKAVPLRQISVCSHEKSCKKVFRACGGGLLRCGVCCDVLRFGFSGL